MLKASSLGSRLNLLPRDSSRNLELTIKTPLFPLSSQLHFKFYSHSLHQLMLLSSNVMPKNAYLNAHLRPDINIYMALPPLYHNFQNLPSNLKIRKLSPANYSFQWTVQSKVHMSGIRRLEGCLGGWSIPCWKQMRQYSIRFRGRGTLLLHVQPMIS